MDHNDLLWLLLPAFFGTVAWLCYFAILGYRALVRWLHRPLRVPRSVPSRDRNVVAMREWQSKRGRAA